MKTLFLTFLVLLFSNFVNSQKYTDKKITVSIFDDEKTIISERLKKDCENFIKKLDPYIDQKIKLKSSLKSKVQITITNKGNIFGQKNSNRQYEIKVDDYDNSILCSQGIYKINDYKDYEYNKINFIRTFCATLINIKDLKLIDGMDEDNLIIFISNYYKN